MKSYGQPDFKRTMDRLFMTKSGKAAIVDHITENKAYRYSYGRLKTMINEVGEILKSAGIAPAERIAVLTKPSAKTAIMLLALSYLGYTAVIPDTSLPAEEQERLLEFTEPSAIITSDELYSNISDELKAKVPVYRMFENIKYSKILELLNKGLKKRVKP
ncbi:MAG: AMP-binding protein, partial [Ruminococcus sp.]|nr:AMP-binding protein [Ruminococcus sp.]